jgi:hypothetical protein
MTLNEQHEDGRDCNGAGDDVLDVEIAEVNWNGTTTTFILDPQ